MLVLRTLLLPTQSTNYIKSDRLSISSVHLASGALWRTPECRPAGVVAVSQTVVQVVREGPPVLTGKRHRQRRSGYEMTRNTRFFPGKIDRKTVIMRTGKQDLSRSDALTSTRVDSCCLYEDHYMVNITKSAGGITFSVDDVEPATAALNCRDLGYGLSTLLPGGVRLNSWSDYNSKVVSDVEFHPLIAAVHLAFADHRPLVISPDMIWTTILQGFSQPVRNNSEALRRKLVKHAEGKVEIGIAMDDLSLESPEIAWHEAIEMLAFALRNEIGDIFDNLMCDFSTTGPVERTVSQIMLLDIYEPFFDYVILAGCGIPSITLEGTSEDWLKLCRKLDVLTDFGLDFWLVHVRPILEQFHRASRGDIDLNHWQRIYKQQTDYGVARINGWIAKLIPYLKGCSEKFDDVNPLLLPSSDPRSEDAEVFSSYCVL